MKNNMRILREQMGITQEELENRIVVSRQAIHAIEIGKFEPSIGMAYDIAQVFLQLIECVFLFEKNKQKSRVDFSRRDHGGIKTIANI